MWCWQKWFNCIKIASTMSSVGSPAFSYQLMTVYMEILEVYQKDLLILISNSGKSQELLPIIKFANRNKIKLIGIVSRKDSSLYRGADIRILLQKSKKQVLI